MPRIKGVMKRNQTRKGSNRRCNTEASKVIEEIMKDNEIKLTGGPHPWMTDDEFLWRTGKKVVKENSPIASKKKATPKKLHALIKTKDNQILKLQNVLGEQIHENDMLRIDIDTAFSAVNESERKAANLKMLLIRQSRLLLA